MYLELFHGRTTLDEQLEDWGTRGPILGPLTYVHTTYATHVKFAFTNSSEGDGWLYIVEDCIYYDGHNDVQPAVAF